MPKVSNSNEICSNSNGNGCSNSSSNEICSNSNSNG